MARKRVIAPIKEYTVEVMGRRFPVVDMVDASRKVEYMRDTTGMGASQMGGHFLIREGDKPIGYVSYNGRVWVGDPDNWEKNVCVYEPSEHRKPPQDPTRLPEAITPVRVIRNPGRIRKCDLHDEPEECEAAPSSCRYGGCDYHGDRGPECLTRAMHYADTKSFMCDEGRRNFLRDYRWDDRRGEWVER